MQKQHPASEYDEYCTAICWSLDDIVEVLRDAQTLMNQGCPRAAAIKVKIAIGKSELVETCMYRCANELQLPY